MCGRVGRGEGDDEEDGARLAEKKGNSTFQINPSPSLPNSHLLLQEKAEIFLQNRFKFTNSLLF